MGDSARGAGNARKRLFDLAFAGGALIVLSPLLLAVFVVLLLLEGRPVFYREPRIGRGGSWFSIRKFRTLQDGSGGTSSVAPEDDPRITRVGRWLRRWRLDEFPQLVNVLNGDMSVVGPRPMSRVHADAIPTAQRTEILTVRPGITSRTSIAFLAEDAVLAECSDAESVYLEQILPVKVDLEIAELRGWTLGSDIRALVSTFLSLWSKHRREESAEMIRGLLKTSL